MSVSEVRLNSFCISEATNCGWEDKLGVTLRKHNKKSITINVIWFNELIIKSNIDVTFTPHLLPIKRGILSTIYIKIKDKYKLEDIKKCLNNKYKNEPFVNFYDNYIPNVHDVAGTNLCSIGIAYDSDSNTCIIISVIDNLIKGASGQALQNLNLMLGIKETEGLIHVPMFL